MAKEPLSEAIQHYLRAIYNLGQEQDRVSVTALAKAQSVAHVLSGDRVVRREAAAQGFTCLSATQVIVLMKNQGLIQAVKPVLDLMRQRLVEYVHAA